MEERPFPDVAEDGREQLHDRRAAIHSLAEELDTLLEEQLTGLAEEETRAARIAAELGDALFATEPDPELVQGYRDAGGTGPRYAEVPMAWAPDEHAAAQAALETSRWALTGWPVMSELPNPANFAAASATVREDDILATFACGPDPARYLEVTQPFVDAGFGRLALLNTGPDPDGFLDFYQRELDARIRSLTVP
jgi:G6PDH family F420-dependent oxidoreductase